MKSKFNKLLSLLTILLLFYFVFIIFGGIANYYKDNINIVLCCAVFYLTTIFFMVKIFNSTINNIILSNYLGKNHIYSIIVAFIFVTFTFFLPVIILFHFNFNFQSFDKILISSFEYIVVAVSEELVFRAFLFLSVLIIIRKLLFSAIIVSLIFTLIHYNSIENIVYFSWIFTTSLLLSYLYFYTKSIASPITFHFLINLLNNNIIVQIDNNIIIIASQVACMILCIIFLLIFSKLKNFDNNSSTFASIVHL